MNFDYHQRIAGMGLGDDGDRCDRDRMATNERGRPKKLRLDNPPVLSDEQHAQAAAFYAKYPDYYVAIWRAEWWRYIDHWGGVAEALRNRIHKPVRHIRYLDACALAEMDVDAIADAYQEQRKYENADMLIGPTSALFSRLGSEVPDDLRSVPDELRKQFSRMAMTVGADMIAVRERDRNDQAAREAWIVEAVRKARRRDGQVAAAVAFLAEVHGLGERMLFKSYRAFRERGDPDWAG